MRSDEFDFELPAELIAQTPTEKRGASRLLQYRRADQRILDDAFSNLPALLQPGDLLVFNDAKVLPARFALVKETGGWVEGLFLRETSGGRWRVLLRNVGNAESLRFAEAPEIAVRVLERGVEGECEIAVESRETAVELLGRIGRMPLPPYIKRGKQGDALDAMDRERYQTVYASASGSVAAPTAGLHFTPKILRELDERGVMRTSVTLHVGMGTFKPLTAETLDAHVMHSENYSISPEAAKALNAAKRERRRIVAVGTTAVRVLESQAAEEPFRACSGSTEIFIYPPYRWGHVGAMITNFHLPRSTLIALVAAWIGLDEQRRVYRHAIEQRYRFFSYGDAMFLE
jgi:S-adenosylmethionine:tRNA ribosyltransferase-isomerase